jgi:hypothetical protein
MFPFEIVALATKAEGNKNTEAYQGNICRKPTGKTAKAIKGNICRSQRGQKSAKANQQT